MTAASTSDHRRTLQDLNSLDRCDRCRAQAAHITAHLHSRPDGSTHITQLMWCEHHYREHWAVLMRYT